MAGISRLQMDAANHNAGGKTGQSALHPIPQTLFQEEYTGSAQGGTEKWGE